VALDAPERFLSYAPHSGFGNQMAALRNAIALAKFLNRTLVLPLLLKHFDVTKGACPNVVPAPELRRRNSLLARSRPRVDAVLDTRAFGVPIAPSPAGGRVVDLDVACLDTARFDAELHRWRESTATELRFGTLYALRDQDASLTPVPLVEPGCLAYKDDLLSLARAALGALPLGPEWTAMHVRTLNNEGTSSRYDWRRALNRTLNKVAARGEGAVYVLSDDHASVARAARELGPARKTILLTAADLPKWFALAMPAEPELIVDVLIALLATRFSGAASSLSSHIAHVRQCPSRTSKIPKKTSEHGLAVVVPTTDSAIDRRRLEAGLARWNAPDFAPCETASVPAVATRVPAACGFSVPRWRSTQRPALLFYASNAAGAAMASEVLSGSLGAAARACFRPAEFGSADLSREQDGYPAGPSYQFYALHAYLLGRPDITHFLLLEPDGVPVRTNWVEGLAHLVPPHAERFWVKGSVVRGPSPVEEWLIHHINGNALYNCEDGKFAAVLRGVREWSQWTQTSHKPLPAYDMAIGRAFYDDKTCHRRKRATTSTPWRREHAHLYKPAEFIVNHHNAWISLDTARSMYPCALFVHGNGTAGSHLHGTTRLSKTNLMTQPLDVPPSGLYCGHRPGMVCRGVGPTKRCWPDDACQPGGSRTRREGS